MQHLGELRSGGSGRSRSPWLSGLEPLGCRTDSSLRVMPPGRLRGLLGPEGLEGLPLSRVELQKGITMSSTSDTAVARTLDAQTARLIGVEAYLYVSAGDDGYHPAPADQHPGRGDAGARADEHGQSHPEFPAADFRVVVRPNFDTLLLSLAGPERRPDGRIGRRHRRALPCCQCWTCGPTSSPRQAAAPPAPRPPTSPWFPG